MRIRLFWTQASWYDRCEFAPDTEKGAYSAKSTPQYEQRHQELALCWPNESDDNKYLSRFESMIVDKDVYA